MKNIIRIITLIVIIAFSSCEKVDYNSLNGVWYGNAQSWHIEFSGRNFTGETKGHNFNGTYTIKRKSLSLKFNNKAPVGFTSFYANISRVNTYNLGNKQLKLYGVNFEILLTK